MKILSNYIYLTLYLLIMVIPGCKKDTLSNEDGAATIIKVYDDANIQVPIQVVAGKGKLLSAYSAYDSPYYRFLLTDNNGNQLWIKDFGVTVVSGMIAEEDGTFTIFDNKRMINIDVAGNVLKDVPDFLSEIDNYQTMHVILNKNGNYFFYGLLGVIVWPHYAFGFEITHTGATVFKKVYTINTIFTGCQLTDDGGYLFLGNYFTNITTLPTQFFICKMNSTGNVDWIKKYTPPGLGFNTANNFFYTHDMLESNDGNYFCFVGSTNFDVTNSARIYKVTSDGDLLDSTDIDFAGKNIFAGGHEGSNYYSYPKMNGFCSRKRPDGTYLVYLNNLGETNANYAVGGNQTFTVHFGDDLSVKHIGYLQNTYSDYFTSVCSTSDGKTAAFGYISSFGNIEKPIILISE